MLNILHYLHEQDVMHLGRWYLCTWIWDDCL